MIENREEFAKYLNNFNKLGVGVEVGVDRGVHGKLLLNGYDGLILFVDPRRKLEGRDSVINTRDYGKMLDMTLKNLKGGNKVILRGTSEEVSKLILDETLDFVYIDAQHSYEGCLEDINFWFSKVRKGGIMSGHDYLNANKGDPIGNTGKTVVENFRVKDAVDYFTSKNGYKVSRTARGNNRYFIK